MDWKELWRKIIFPPVWLMVLLIVVSGAALFFVFIKDLSASPVAYGVYLISFYTVCVLSVFFSVSLPRQYKNVRRRINAHPLGHRYLTDTSFKVHVSLFGGLAVNLLYAAVNVLSFLLYRSMWFVVLAVYYVILAVMRFLLVRYVRLRKLGQDRPGELRRAKLCSCILLLLNFVLTGAVMMILYRNKGFEYHGILIYVMAAYTFYMTVRAIVDLVRYRKYHSPVMTTSKIIALSAALVSMLSLETAMFSQFGRDMAAEHQRLMIALTGAGVSIVVIVLSVYMIVRSTKEMKEIQKDGREKRSV